MVVTWVQEPVELANTVDTYSITVVTTPQGCTANADSMLRRMSSLDGSQRTLTIGVLEEFSEVTVNITAVNPIGASSASVAFETPSAGKTITYQPKMAGGI